VSPFRRRRVSKETIWVAECEVEPGVVVVAFGASEAEAERALDDLLEVEERAIA